MKKYLLLNHFPCLLPLPPLLMMKALLGLPPLQSFRPFHHLFHQIEAKRNLILLNPASVSIRKRSPRNCFISKSPYSLRAQSSQHNYFLIKKNLVRLVKLCESEGTRKTLRAASGSDVFRTIAIEY